MQRYATRTLKKDEDAIIDGAKAQALASAIQAVSMAVGREQRQKLLNKETACCRLATD